jgi:DNA-binding NtrC family response regulator
MRHPRPLTPLREIKARQPELPVMIVTAYGDYERRADELGAAQFITKPVDFDPLASKS